MGVFAKEGSLRSGFVIACSQAKSVDDDFRQVKTSRTSLYQANSYNFHKTRPFPDHTGNRMGLAFCRGFIGHWFSSAYRPSWWLIRFVSFSVFVHLSISLSTYVFCLYNALRDVPCKPRDLMYSLLSIAFPLSIVEEPTKTLSLKGCFQSIHKLGGILVIQGFILKPPISRVYSQMQLVSAHRRSVLRWGGSWDITGQHLSVH